MGTTKRLGISSNYIHNWCNTCVVNPLSDNDVWNDLDICQEVNSGLHDALMSCAYLRKVENRCGGCFRVNRRRVKLLAYFLYKLVDSYRRRRDAEYNGIF